MSDLVYTVTKQVEFSESPRHYPGSVHPDIDGAGQAARTTTRHHDVAAWRLGALEHDPPTVVGYHHSPLRKAIWGKVPHPAVEPWSDEKVAMYNQLRERFPRRPEPEGARDWEPGPAAPLPVEAIFAVVRRAKDFDYRSSRWVDFDRVTAFAASLDEAVGVAAAGAPAGATTAPYVVQIGYGPLPWTPQIRLAAPVVWTAPLSFVESLPDDEADAALRAMEAELAGGTGEAPDPGA